MASNRVLAKSINMPFLQSNNKFIYVSLLVVLSFFLLLDYVPGMHAYSAWVTPPLALFLGLAFALLCGQAHPKFNKKTSKYLLQYSVVGLGFGMNLQASLASGKEGMEFTIISVVGTLLIGWLIAMWQASGIIPMIIASGIELINPNLFIICALWVRY